MEYKDYYKILGVDKRANEAEIKKAYRRLARQYHPDFNRGDKRAETRFKDINEAHEVLSDPQKRRKYDRLGVNWQAYRRAGWDPSGFDWGPWTAREAGGTPVDHANLSDLFGESAFSDFFQSIFGGNASFRGGTSYRPRTGRGRDVEQPVDISLEEAFNGTQRLLSVEGRRLEVRIPPGARSGSRVRVAGEGYPAENGVPAGDLYLVVSVRPHPVFQRDGDDLRCEVTIGLYTAVLGGEVTVPTISGKGTLRIPQGTQPGQMFRLSGQGMPSLHHPNRRGCQLVRVKVRLPDRISDQERRLFQQLAMLDH